MRRRDRRALRGALARGGRGARRARPRGVRARARRALRRPRASLGGRADRVQLVAHTLLHAGAKSVSHVEKLLDKYAWLLAHVAADARSRALLVGASCSYWAKSPQMRSIVASKLLHHGLVDASSALSHAFSPAGRQALLDGTGWELVRGRRLRVIEVTQVGGLVHALRLQVIEIPWSRLHMRRRGPRRPREGIFLARARGCARLGDRA